MTVAQRSDVAVAAQLFRGFGDPTRLAILTELLAGERRVGAHERELPMLLIASAVTLGAAAAETGVGVGVNGSFAFFPGLAVYGGWDRYAFAVDSESLIGSRITRTAMSS